MKRKFADMRNWERVTERRFKLTYVKNEKFEGYISLIYIDKVKTPLVINYGENNIYLADDGYFWLRFFPTNCAYSLIAMFNDKKEPVEWYFDICKGNKLNDKGIPYFDDLYLDVVVLPPYEVFTLDEDELEEALEAKEITKKDYDFAYTEMNKLLEDIKYKRISLIEDSNKYLDYIMCLD